MTSAEEKLILENIGLAYDIAWKYYKKFQGYMEMEELKSISILGLTKAASTFNESLGNAFTTYAYKVIVNEILMNNRKENKHKYNISLSDKISDDLEIQDIISTDYDLFEDIDISVKIDILKEEINKLEDRYKTIMTYALQGMTQTEIGKRIGLSQAHVARLYNKGLNMLRFRLRDLRG